jgi:hypothetical protein
MVKEKHQITYKDKPIRITADFSTETLQARRVWNEVFQNLKENTCQTRLLFAEKQSLIIETEIKTLHDKQN